MTYTTRVAVVQPVPLLHLMDFVNAELLHAENPERDERPGRLGNMPGQGLDAWVWIDYSPDGPLGRGEYDDGPLCALELVFDSCGLGGRRSLHERYLRQLAPWFAERGVDWLWQDDDSDTWHSGVLTPCGS